MNTNFLEQKLLHALSKETGLDIKILDKGYESVESIDKLISIIHTADKIKDPISFLKLAFKIEPAFREENMSSLNEKIKVSKLTKDDISYMKKQDAINHFEQACIKASEEIQKLSLTAKQLINFGK